MRKPVFNLNVIYSQNRHEYMQACCNMSILPACCNLSTNLATNFSVVSPCHLQTWHNLFKQLVPSLWITSFDNQLPTNLLTTCNRLIVDNKSVDTSSNRLVATTVFFAVQIKLGHLEASHSTLKNHD